MRLMVLKLVMVAFSVIIMAAGAAGLLVGAWMALSPASMALFGRIGIGIPIPAELEAFQNLDHLLMVAGAILLGVGLLACCGALGECRPCLLLHFVLVLVLFAAGLAGAVAAMGFTHQLAARALDDIKRDYGGGGKSPNFVTQFWTVTMDVVGCCGVHDYTDFVGSPQYARSNETFPPQCCVTPDDVGGGHREAYCDSQRAHDASVGGCLPKTRELISENRRLVAFVVIGVMYVEICAMVVSMILYCQIRIKRLVPPGYVGTT